MKKHLPTILTLVRVGLLPILILGFYLEQYSGNVITYYLFGLFILCAFTDFLDGWVARKMNTTSAFGAFLDPVSDKIFVATLLVCLVGFDRLSGLWVVPVILILAREFTISGLREFLGKHSISLPVTSLAKWKTTFQMLSMGLLILAPTELFPFTLDLGRGALLAAMLLTLLTGAQYFKAGLEVIRKMP